MKKMIHRLLIVLLCTLIPTFLYIKTPSLEGQSKGLSETKVVMVNEDMGITIDDQPYNFAQVLIEKLIRESSFDMSTSNFADAFNALERGDVKYVIVFDSEFSKSVNSFDDVNQISAKVKYYYNHTYDTSVQGNIDSENERNKIFDILQNEISTVYNKTIVNKVEESKEMLRNDISNDIDLVEEIRTTSEDNTSSLQSDISAANQHISGFNNEMGDKISKIDENVSNAKETEAVIIDKSNENKQINENDIVFYDSFKTGIEDNYNMNLSEFLEYSELLVGDNGVAPYIVDDAIPVYIKYSEQYEININMLSSLITYDELDLGNLCSVGYDYTDLKTRLANLEISYVDTITKEISTSKLLTKSEIDELIEEAYNTCSEKSSLWQTDYNIGTSESLNNLFVSNKNILLNEIKEESNSKSINITTFQNSNAVVVINIGDNAPGSSVRLSENQIADFNTFNKMMAILEEKTSFTQVKYDSTKEYYMSVTNYNNFESLKTILLKEYELYGGTYSDVRSILNSNSLGELNNFYGINTLNTLDNQNFSYIKNEYTDISNEISLLSEYENSVFYHQLEKSLIAKYSERFFVSDSSAMAMDDYSNSIINFINLSVEESNILIEEYEELHGSNLTKLNDDSDLIIASYNKAGELNSIIIESGNINLGNYSSMEENSKLIKEENTEIINHTSQVLENNNTINETVRTNEENYSDSLEKLEESNEEQKDFVENYEKILSNANQNGVSNNDFYNYIVNPIEFSNEDIGENVSGLNSYFIMSWLFMGLLFISAVSKKYKDKFTLGLNTGDFKESAITKFINQYLIYILTILTFGFIYSLMLVLKFEIDNAITFIIKIILLSLLISYIMYKLITRFKFYGYLIIVFVISIMYILLFINDTSIFNRIVALPIAMFNNFIMANIYNVTYQNAYLYTLLLYVIMAGIITILDIFVKKMMRNTNEV